ncbi:MAG: GNAT family N-acetyltransferase [Chloroflexi bacterium]|nr:GNAT family N-acetyltransferase [Chloroflexota bacterium]
MPVPTRLLRDDAIAIRPFKPEDARPVFEAIDESRAEAAPWLPDLARVTSVDEVEAYIAAQPSLWEAGEAYNFLVTNSDDTMVLGGCGLTQIHARHRFANLYYWVRSSATGRGVATRAVKLLAQFGFEEPGLNRLEILVVKGNDDSVRVAEKAGAKREGLLRNRIAYDGNPQNTFMFSLIPADLTH